MRNECDCHNLIQLWIFVRFGVADYSFCFQTIGEGHTHVLWRACIHNTRDCFMSLTSCFLTNQWASVHSTLSIPCPMKWRVFVTALWRHLRGRLPSNSKLDEVLSNISRKQAAFIVDSLHCETPLLYVVPICIYSIHVRWVTFHESTCRSLKHVLFLELFIFSCQFNVKLRENLSRRYHSVIGCRPTQSTGAR